MKKIFALCSLIICVSLMLTVFVSCSKDKDNDNTNANESNIVSVTNGEFVFTAEVGENNTVIKNNGEEYQVLEYPNGVGHRFDLEYAKAHTAFLDMNFDGQPDFYIEVSLNGKTKNYYCWLFNATSKKFDPSPMLSTLTNISIDAENHIVYSTQYVGDVERVVEYVWVNGQLTYKEVYDNEDGTIPPEVSQSVQENAIGTVTNPAKPATSTEAKTTKTDNANSSATNQSSSTTQEKKPLNTTTTSPRVGIEVETGDINEGWY